MRSRLLKFVLFGVAAAAQQQTVKSTSNSNLVISDVTVRDKAGNPIENLKKEDFTVFEDSKPQAISVFEFQKLANEELPRLPTPTPPPKNVPIERKVETIAAPGA